MADELELYGEPVRIGGAAPARPVAEREREHAIGWLRYHCGLGTLDLDEFGDRAGDVYGAQNEVELWRALDGLDVPRANATPVPIPDVTPAERRRPGRKWHVAVFGGAERKGPWRVATSSVALAMFGGVDLDMRAASLEDPEAAEITLNAFAVFGGVEIIVPEGMEVDATGLALFGGKDVNLADVQRNRSLPVLRVRAWVLFGGVDVTSRRSLADERAARDRKRAERDEEKRARRERRGRDRHDDDRS